MPQLFVVPAEELLQRRGTHESMAAGIEQIAKHIYGAGVIFNMLEHVVHHHEVALHAELREAAEVTAVDLAAGRSLCARDFERRRIGLASDDLQTIAWATALKSPAPQPMLISVMPGRA